MKVIDKRYKDTVSFDSLKAGDTFIDDNDIYMKIVQVIIDDFEFNAVNLYSGNLVGYDNDYRVVAVEAEVSYK